MKEGNSKKGLLSNNGKDWKKEAKFFNWNLWD